MEMVDVVIVEAHHHCLEHIHAVLRKKKIFRSWRMIHFDAHPDLACPAIPAVACFTPREPVDGEKNLYEMLDSRASGIAEWILPLTLAAHLHTIEWIKPEFSNQLPRGHHSIQVGTHDLCWRNGKPSHFLDMGLGAHLKVDWRHPYYLEDSVVVPASDLALPQSLTLHVTELNSDGDELILGVSKDIPAEPWILDICLDYFACWNPYLSEIDAVDPELTDAFLEVMKQCILFGPKYDVPEMDTEVSRAYVEQLHDFRNILRKALEATFQGMNSETASTIETKLWRYYAKPEICQRLMLILGARIQSHGPSALQRVLEAIPFWNMPHEVSSTETSAIQKSIHRVERSLQRFLRNQQYPVLQPFLITIARSTCDGFAPGEVVESIQDGVLAMLDRLFNVGVDPRNEQRLRITKDYGEWEGSTLPV
jgi:UPF0489 domain